MARNAIGELIAEFQRATAMAYEHEEAAHKARTKTDARYLFLLAFMYATIAETLANVIAYLSPDYKVKQEWRRIRDKWRGIRWHYMSPLFP